MSQEFQLFQIIFMNLIQDLSNYYPEYREFKEYHTFLNTYGVDFIWKEMIKQYTVYIEPFRQQIEEKNEAFFLSKELENNLHPEVKELGIEQELDKIRELYFKEKTTPEIKEQIWDYITKLTFLAFENK